MGNHATDIGGFWRIENRPISHVGVVPYLGKTVDFRKDPKTGKPLFGLDPKKIYWVFRSPEALFDPDAIASFNGKPFIDEHVMLGTRKSVGGKTAKKVGLTPVEELPAEGTITNVRESKDRPGFLIADFDIWTERMQKKIEGGKKQLSLGYFCEYKPQKGVYNGKAYDFVQTNLRGNHIALVERGRMGSACCVCDNAITVDLIEGIHDSMETNKDDAKKDVKPEDALAECLAGADDELCQKVLDFIAKEKSAKGGDSASGDGGEAAATGDAEPKKQSPDGQGADGGNAGADGNTGADAGATTDGAASTPPPPPPKKKDGEDGKGGADGNAQTSGENGGGEGGNAQTEGGEAKKDGGDGETKKDGDQTQTDGGNGGGEGKGDDANKGDGDGETGATADGCKGKKEKKDTATAQDGASTSTEGSASATKQNLEANADGDDGKGKGNENKDDGDSGNGDDGNGGAQPAKKDDAPATGTDCGTTQKKPTGTGTDCGGTGIAKDTFVEISKAIHRRDLLARACSDVIGTFDASEMTEEEVAKYAVSELGIACDSGEELATIRGYMACRAKMSSQDAVAFAADSAADLANHSAKKGDGAKSKSDLMKQYLG